MPRKELFFLSGDPAPALAPALAAAFVGWSEANETDELPGGSSLPSPPPSSLCRWGAESTSFLAELRAPGPRGESSPDWSIAASASNFWFMVCFRSWTSDCTEFFAFADSSAEKLAAAAASFAPPPPAPSFPAAPAPAAVSALSGERTWLALRSCIFEDRSSKCSVVSSSNSAGLAISDSGFSNSSFSLSSNPSYSKSYT
mmetsp:Transcript_10911/g.21807  ORF Transcript_10911/g.21807 Transcript_10911/m.21807 type:complete len:200 (+) Transcript_10911:105-704(+)